MYRTFRFKTRSQPRPSLPSVPFSVSRRPVKGCLVPTDKPRNKKMHRDTKKVGNQLIVRRKSGPEMALENPGRRQHPESRTESRPENDRMQPTRTDSGPNPGRGTTKGAADAAPFPQAMPRIRPKAQRFENWNDRRAFALPYFLRSTTRLSRVRKPAAFSEPRSAGS